MKNNMKEENLYTPDCIRTFSGQYVNVFDPDPDTILIEDIAHALSMQCRFGGHLPVFYSVAQHSVRVAKIEHTLQALMHDAAEAYLLDVPSPIKKRLPGYREIEDNLLRVIGEKFGFNPVLSEETKFADRTLLEIEWERIMLKKGNMPSTPVWTSSKSKEYFMYFFNRLSS